MKEYKVKVIDYVNEIRYQEVLSPEEKNTLFSL